MAVVAGLGGALLLVINRRVLTAGVMIALGLVPAMALAAMAGIAMALVAAGTELVLLGVGRSAVDASLVTATSAAVLLWHRRHDGRAATG